MQKPKAVFVFCHERTTYRYVYLDITQAVSRVPSSDFVLKSSLVALVRLRFSKEQNCTISNTAVRSWFFV